MTFTPPLAWTVIGWGAAALAALTIVAYILKMRRRRHEVPFSKLWQRVLRERESEALWKRLRRLLSLAVQLVFLALLVFAALDPRVGEAESSGRSVVLIIDASASMQARDQGRDAPARIDRAQARAREVLAGLGGASSAMVIRMDGQATALSRFESDVPRLTKLVDEIVASDTPADLPRALQAAADALRGRKDPMIVLVGDGGYPEEALGRVTFVPAPGVLSLVDLTGIDVRFVPVGEEGRNVGIVAFNVRRYISNKLSYEALVEVESFSTEPETVKLTLTSGGDALDVKTVRLAPGERQRHIYPDLGGGDERALRAVLEPLGDDGGARPDVFALDDSASALLPERKKQRVLTVTRDNLYLEAALLLDTNIHVDKIRPEEYATELAAGRLEGYSVTVLDGFAPESPPPTPASIYFRPDPERSPVPARGELERPFITEVNPDHPLTRWVTLGDVNIDRSLVLAPAAGDVVIARSVRDPLIVAGRRAGKKVVVFGFGLDATDLTLRVAFPILLVNALDWFAGDDAELITTYRTGRVWSIPVDPDERLREVDVRGPGGRQKAPVARGRARFYGAQAGIYQIDVPGGEPLALAANLADPVESRIAPRTELKLAGRIIPAPPSFTPSVSRSIWTYLVLGALLLSTVEWLTYNRRVTV